VAPESNQHLGGEDAEKYSLGEMSEQELARCEEHLLICDPCRRQVEESDAYVAAMREAAGQLRKGSEKTEGGGTPPERGVS
jgi:anti-sigma factor RsiW